MTVKMEDVARQAGVSTATVSRAINNPELVSHDTRERVFEAMQVLGYRLNLAARSLRTKQTRTIAIVIPTISEPVINQVVEAVEDSAIEENYTLLVCSTRGKIKREQAYIRLITEQTLVDGVLYISPRSAPKQVLKLAHGSAPLVLCNYTTDFVEAPAILINHISSIYQATSYLLALGHRRIALLNLAAPYYQPARMRHQGFERALAERQLRPDPAYIVEIDHPTYAHDQWRTAINDLLDYPSPPTAIVAFNDQVALQVYAVCRARGLRIPDDLSVTGCDDIPTAQYLEPPLTTVEIPAARQGQLAMQYLLALLRDEKPDVPQITQLDVTLVIRESCAPPKS